MAETLDHVRFLRRSHRRWVLWRIVECAGIGAAIGSAVGFFILPVLFWREQSAIEPAGVLLLVGTISGALFGLTRRPTLIQTALEADRQLKLNDLLSSAVMCGGTSMDDGFAALVQAQAEEISRRLLPNELIVRRLGGQAWGGIGIGSSLLLTLAMMTAQPGTSQARVDGLDGQDGRAKMSIPANENQLAQANQTAQPSPRSADQSDRRASDNSLDERDGDPSPRASATSSRGSGSARGDGTGSSAGRTSDASIPRLIESSDSATNDAKGKPSQGSGNAAGDAIGTSPALATGAGVKYQTTSAPPWQSATWSADRAEAIKDVESGRTPDAYRNLVREYFDLRQR